MARILDRGVDLQRVESGSALRRPVVLAVALAVAGILAIHAETAWSLVSIWTRSETFTHGFLIAPLSLWLVYRRRDTLAGTEAKPCYPALAAIVACSLLWLVATLADVAVARQFALVFMIQAAIVAVAGWRLARAAAFPLAFLLFAVPFGEFLVPSMIDRTADFTVAALRATGVPVYREANHLIIPSGAWSVVEACSGIRYLIASVVVGTLFAMESYRTTRYRATFIALSIVVPLVANWLRAYGIVLLGHLSDNRIAVGVDHLIYGWLFFGVVMLVLFWFGSLWREPQVVGERLAAHVPLPTSGPSAGRGYFGVAMSAIVAAAVFAPLPSVLDRDPRPESVSLPRVAPGAAWTPTSEAFTTWKPRFSGFVAESAQQFATPGEMPIGIYLAFFRNQREGRELVTSKQMLVSNDDPVWRLMRRSTEPVEWNGKLVTAQSAIVASGESGVWVYRLYWIGGRTTSSDAMAKLFLAGEKLLGRGDDSALVVIYTKSGPDDARARQRLQRAVADLSPGIERALTAARGEPR